ncbi:hypothetical protein OAM01_02890 [bacterium]|nr:hypothetical protein [bacterium]
MKTLLQIIVAILYVSISNPAQALYMVLDRPGLALPDGFSEESRKGFQQVLEHSDYKFLGGSAMNWNTNLRYEGSTKKLNSFLHALSNCDGVIITLTFVESLPQGGDWHVHHSANEKGGFGFHIRVSTSSDNIQLTELILPVIRSASSEEQGIENKTD